MAKKAAKKKTVMKKAAPKKVVVAKVAAPTPAKNPTPAKKMRAASRPRNATSYTQTEMIENIRAFCGLTKRSAAREICDDIAAFITDSLRKGYKIPLMGLGKIYVRHTKPRQGRNPATGEVISIPAKKRVRFTPAKSLKEAVL